MNEFHHFKNREDAGAQLARQLAQYAGRDDVVVLRVESGLFFANADHVRAQVRERITPSTVAVIPNAIASRPRCDGAGAWSWPPASAGAPWS